MLDYAPSQALCWTEPPPVTPTAVLVRRRYSHWYSAFCRKPMSNKESDLQCFAGAPEAPLCSDSHLL